MREPNKRTIKITQEAQEIMLTPKAANESPAMNTGERSRRQQKRNSKFS
jgi:hypothetical protein